MIVDSLMRRSVRTLHSSASARAAAELMRDRSIGSVVVVHDGAPVGIVTERDLVGRVLAARRDPDATSLRDVMSTPLATIEPSASIEDAVARMRELRIKRLVVAMDGRVRGILTVTDVAYAEPELTRSLVEGWVKQRWEG